MKGGQIDTPQKKLSSKSPALLGLSKILTALDLFDMFKQSI